ncbi:hypothetical protein FPOA_03512 [Fusarium poae]|uniref:Uncharacterized protein n=1 Tax=Fusarium poae TaxID=36050 RepID=A0A1B8BA19_FUSPO|nr:hypothetical protein FPOA_03512 [Fusarium poae]
MEDGEATSHAGEGENPFHLANLWTKAYTKVHENGEYSQLLKDFEIHLQQANDNQIELVSATTPSSSGGLARLKDIQRLAQKKLEVVNQGHTFFFVRGKRIVVREAVQKAIQQVTQFKAIINGAVSAEPHAALAWACVLGVLPILESVYQQDEDAADGFNKIVFTMIRYQHLLQTVVLRDFTKSSQDGNTSQLFSNMETQLVSFYEQVYLYQIQFIRQYGKSKWRRNMGNMFNPKDWKQKWSTIDSVREIIDTSIRDRVSARSLDSWEAVMSIEKRTENVLKTVEEIQDGQQAAHEWELLKSLQTASNATFDSSDVQGAQNYCLEGTQHNILNEIRNWAESPTGQFIFWLHGMAGTGKSSVALTVANALKEVKPFTRSNPSPKNATLGASFFFKQGDATRNSTRGFFSTLARDLADVSSNFKTLIAQAIEKNPSITTKAPQQQLEHLIVNPLSILDDRSFLPIHLIVVVDALDECIDRREAEDLVRMLSVRSESLHRVQLRFLITSRSENHLTRAFGQLHEDVCRSVVLEKIKQRVREDDRLDDITLYFEKTIATIAKRHGVEPSVIDDTTIKSLSKTSDGLFIYAATICRFLDAEDFDFDEARQERLELILQNSKDNEDSATDDSEMDEWEVDSPQNHVDEIYCKVLSFPDREKMSPAMKKKTYKDMGIVFGFLVIFFEPVSISSLKVFLPQISKSLDKLLNKVRAIVVVPPDERSPLKLIHLSFRDFILSKKRSKRLKFHVDENEIHELVLTRCLDIMSSKLHQDICNLVHPGTLDSEIPPDTLEARIPQHLRYTCKYWVNHLSNLGRDRQRDVWLLKGGKIHGFLQQHFLHWLEVMSLINEGPAAILIVNQLQTLSEESDALELSSSAYDMKRFILSNRWIVDHAPLQIYVSAVLFSPTDITIRPLLDSYMPPWIQQPPKNENRWTHEVCILNGHTDITTAMSFSPTGNLLASSTVDGTTILWDYATGTELSKLEGDGWVVCVSVSWDGKFIALGFKEENTVVVRDILSGSRVILQDHEQPVRFTIFSPKDNNILVSVFSICDEQTLTIWDVKSRRTKHMVTILDCWVEEIQFTEDGDSLIIPADDSITILNVNTGQSAQRLNGSPATIVNGVTIPVEFETLIVCERVAKQDGDEKYISNDDKLWSISFVHRSTGETMVQYFYQEDFAHISCVTLGGNSVLIRTESGSIELLGTRSWSRVGQFYVDPSLFVFAIQKDGKLMASLGSGDYGIRLYDIRQNTTGNQLSQRHSQQIWKLRFSPDLSLIAANVDGYPELYDSTGSLISLPVDEVPQIDFCGRYVILTIDLSSQIWNSSMTELLFTSSCGIRSFNDSVIAASPRSGQIQILNTSTLDEIMMWHNVDSYRFSSDGDMACILYTDPNSRTSILELWNLLSMERLWCKPAEKSMLIGACRFSPDKNVFIYTCIFGDLLRENSCKIVYLKTGKEESMVEWDRLIFHPESHLLAIKLLFSRDIDIRKTDSLELLHKFKIPSQTHLSMAFSGRATFAASWRMGPEPDIRFWDVGSGSKIGQYSVAGRITDLSMHDDDYIVCQQGRLPILSSVPDEERKNAGNHVQDLLYVGLQWVYHGLERIIWLPPTLRSRASILRGNTLAIPCEGGIKVIKFDLDKLSAR